MKHILPSIILVAFMATAAIAQPPPPPGVAASLVINEVDYDQISSDSLEFIEIYNFGVSPVMLNTVIVAMINGANGIPYDTIFLPAVSLAPNDYFVICSNGSTVDNCDMEVDAPDNFIQNGSPDALLIFDLIEQSVVDALSYEGDVAGIVEGTGTGTSTSDNNDDANVSLSRDPSSSDTQDNSADFSLRCATPGAVNTTNDTNCDGLVSVKRPTKRGFIMYPNPVNAELNLWLTDIEVGSRVTISNVLGVEVSHTRTSGQQLKINTNSLPEGVYFVSVESTRSKSTKRFIKR